MHHFKFLNWMIVMTIGVFSGCATRSFDVDHMRFLFENIDREPDLIHRDVTPAVLALENCVGEPALRPALKLMLSSGNEDTRLRAQYLIEVLSKRVFKDERTEWVRDDYSRWEALQQSLGKIDYKASCGVRKTTVTNWEAWLNEHEKAKK